MAYNLTRKQRDLLIFIQTYTDRHGVVPSYDEMRIGLGLASKSGVNRLIVGLEQRGWIDRGVPECARVMSIKKRWEHTEELTPDLLAVSRDIRALADRVLDVARAAHVPMRRHP
jgi:repressor LexA